MRNILIATLLVVPGSVVAQNQVSHRLDRAQMQQVASQMQAMRDCLRTVDQVEMHSFTAESKHMSTEVKRLCAVGERDQAMSISVASARDVSKNKALLEIKRCSEGTTQAMPLLLAVAPNQDQNIATKHVCD